MTIEEFAEFFFQIYSQELLDFLGLNIDRLDEVCGESLSQKNNQLLHLFVRDNQSELADFILDYPEVKVGQGFGTALLYAVHHGRNEMTCLLIDARWDNIVRAPYWVRNNPDINSSYRQGRIQIATAINQDIEDAQQQILLMGGDDIFLQQLYQRHFMRSQTYTTTEKLASRKCSPRQVI